MALRLVKHLWVDVRGARAYWNDSAIRCIHDLPFDAAACAKCAELLAPEAEPADGPRTYLTVLEVRLDKLCWPADPAHCVHGWRVGQEACAACSQMLKAGGAPPVTFPNGLESYVAAVADGAYAAAHKGPDECAGAPPPQWHDGYSGAAQAQSAVVDPPHYAWHPAGIRAWDVTEYFNHNIGSAIDYLWRCGRKDIAPPAEDLKKAIQWIQHEVDRVEREAARKEVGRHD